MRLSADHAAGHAARSAAFDNETWSYHFTPDVRCGREPLYQAFQLHRHHLHRYEWEMITMERRIFYSVPRARRQTAFSQVRATALEPR